MCLPSGEKTWLAVVPLARVNRSQCAGAVNPVQRTISYASFAAAEGDEHSVPRDVIGNVAAGSLPDVFSYWERGSSKFKPPCVKWGREQPSALCVIK